MRGNNGSRLAVGVAKFEGQIRCLCQLLPAVVRNLSVTNNAVVESGGEAIDFASLAKIILDDVKKLFCDSVFPFGRHRESAFSELLKGSQQDPPDEQDDGKTEARVREMVSLRWNAQRE